MREVSYEPEIDFFVAGVTTNALCFNIPELLMGMCKPCHENGEITESVAGEKSY